MHFELHIDRFGSLLKRRLLFFAEKRMHSLEYAARYGSVQEGKHAREDAGKAMDTQSRAACGYAGGHCAGDAVRE